MANLPELARIPTVMDDPADLAVARVYALALINADAANAETMIEEYQSFLSDVLFAHPEFDRLLRDSILTNDERLALIDRTVAGQCSPTFANFLRVLAKHGRLGLLPEILDAVRVEWEQRTNKIRVQIRSAQALSDGERQAVSARLAEQLQLQPILETFVDPSLLGGLVVRVGDTVYDGSLRTRLKQLRVNMRERWLNEIQRGRDRFSHPEGN